jgi:hypothetical protein
MCVFERVKSWESTLYICEKGIIVLEYLSLGHAGKS